MARPTSLWQPNRQTNSLLVITSYQNLDMFAMWINYMLEVILVLRIKYDDNRNQIFFVMRTIHHVKKIAIRPVFLWYPLNFSSFLLLSNPIKKQRDKKPSGSMQITYSFTRLKNSITNSEIRSLNPFNATLSSLFHKDRLGTVPVCTRW